MSTHQLIYIVFAGVVLISLFLDLVLMSKKNTIISLQKALIQTCFWVSIALLFFAFLWHEQGKKAALEYISAYVMEWSLSVDNIFVFIIIFKSFNVKQQYYGRALLIGILTAIFLRVIFISIGVELVETFQWILYLFGIFLLYSGYKMFSTNEEEEFNPKTSKIYFFIKKFFPLTMSDGNGKMLIRENGRPVYTSIFVVVILLGFVDLIFALDSIPAVMGISRDKMIIYTSNIFAVLGLRSLFFLLRSANDQFKYLQQGIAVILMLIGIKMLAEKWLSLFLSNESQTILSLLIILLCIGASIGYSIVVDKKEEKKHNK
jgi:tellurite resistance protein TerC